MGRGKKSSLKALLIGEKNGEGKGMSRRRRGDDQFIIRNPTIRGKAFIGRQRPPTIDRQILLISFCIWDVIEPKREKGKTQRRKQERKSFIWGVS